MATSASDSDSDTTFLAGEEARYAEEEVKSRRRAAPAEGGGVRAVRLQARLLSTPPPSARGRRDGAAARRRLRGGTLLPRCPLAHSPRPPLLGLAQTTSPAAPAGAVAAR